MSLTIDSQLSTSKYRDALQEYYPSGYMTPPSSATSRRHSAAMSMDSSGEFLSTSFSTSDSSSFSELLTPKSLTPAASCRRHSTAYSGFQTHTISDPSPEDPRVYTEPSTPSDWPQSSISECFVLDASYQCTTSSLPFPSDLKFGDLNEGLLITMPAAPNGLSANLASQDLQEGQISSYDQATSLAVGDIPGFDPITALENSFLSSDMGYSPDSIGLPSASSTSWSSHLTSPETVIPSHTFMLSSPPSSPSTHQLGSPIKLEQPQQRRSFDTSSAYNEVSPGSSPTMPEHRLLEVTATPTRRNRGLGRFRRVGRVSGWKSENKRARQFPGCDIRKIETIETNPCQPCTYMLDKRVAFKRPEHLKRHLITDQHTKNVMEYAKELKIKCPSPIEKPIYPCLVPNCKKGLEKSPFVGRRDNLAQHYKNTHFHDKHRNGGGKNDWISIERADELGLASKDPRNKEKYEG